MSETSTTNKTKALIHKLAEALSGEIEMNYLPAELAGCSHALVPLLQARVFGPLPAHVERTIELITHDVVTIPHFACSGCDAVFADDEDLETDFMPVRDPHKDPELPIMGACPVCGSAVHPEEPAE